MPQQTDTAAGAAALIEHLEALKRRGQERVHLGEEAKAALSAVPPRRPSPEAPKSSVREPARAERPPREEGSTAPVSPSPAAQDPTARSNPSPAAKDPTARSKRQALGGVRARAEACPRCRALGSLRDTFVFAVGNPEADLVFVGEAPGSDEERLGEPFVGKAGQLLDKIIQAMGLRREDVYISNIVKWRPKVGDGTRQGTSNRKPTAEEMAAAREYVLEEIAIIKPGAIVALGGTAAQGLLENEGSVASMRGRFHEVAGIPVLVTYHPAYLLRNQSLSERRKVWEDMLMAMEKLGMPISEKQRKFFQG